MPRLDWFAFYPADYDADTWHLTPMQDYAYFRILKAIFLQGQHLNPPSIPDDDRRLRALCKPNSDEEWEETREVLIDGQYALLASDGNWITQKRMTAEIQKASQRVEHARKAANDRWNGTTHADGADRASTVKSGPKSSNGNGAKHMSKPQYRFFVTKISNWQDETGSLYAGGDGSDWERAFRAEFGMNWSEWQAEIEFQRQHA